MRRVVCAANRDKKSGLIVCGARHYDTVMQPQIVLLGCTQFGDMEQGFIDQWGVFMTREEAWVVAEAANQIIRRVGGDGKKLYSENLY